MIKDPNIGSHSGSIGGVFESASHKRADTQNTPINLPSDIPTIITDAGNEAIICQEEGKTFFYDEKGDQIFGNFEMNGKSAVTFPFKCPNEWTTDTTQKFVNDAARALIVVNYHGKGKTGLSAAIKDYSNEDQSLKAKFDPASGSHTLANADINMEYTSRPSLDDGVA